MNLEKRIKTFAKLGRYLEEDMFKMEADQLHLAEAKNPWFTQKNIREAISEWQKLLNEESLQSWLFPYKINNLERPKNILVVMAGNIPLVGFHDFLSVLILGHNIIIKMSDNDNILLKVIIEVLLRINPEFKDNIAFVDDIKNKKFDAVIATGSDNSAKYFQYYFKDAKKIIRKNKRSVAILDGTESNLQLKGLANDIFAYFGLGCRNVSKIFLKDGYDLDRLFDAFYVYNKIIEHQKYRNNYDYNKAIFLMGKNKLIENGFLLMKEDSSLQSPVAMLYYEYYNQIGIVKNFIKKNIDQLQCVVSKSDMSFGSTQEPKLWDYADGIDTINFLRDW